MEPIYTSINYSLIVHILGFDLLHCAVMLLLAVEVQHQEIGEQFGPANQRSKSNKHLNKLNLGHRCVELDHHIVGGGFLCQSHV